MHILYYHWVPFYEYKKTGGGIAVYMNNLISYLCKNTKHKVTCLCSGYKGHPYKKKVYLKQTNNPYSKIGCKTWEIINAPIIAPCAFHDFNPRLAYNDNETSDLFVKFVKDQGGFDVIHFQSLEGIPPQTLEKLKKNFPNCRLIFSVHDYHSVCPGIRLFQQKKGFNCKDYCNGNACLNCTYDMPKKSYYTHLSRYIKDPYNRPFLAQLYRILFRHSFIRRNWNNSHKQEATAADYVLFRKTFIKYLNNYIDVICPVSNRTGQVMVEKGVRADLMKTLYIGTNVAKNAHGQQAYIPNDVFTIVFLGYVTSKEKGFPFLLKTLSTLPDVIAKKLRLIVAARDVNKIPIHNTLNNFFEVITYKGYRHEQLPEILKECNLGIIPVQWEDNLPQVALEMVANGIPILCSDLGGASELSHCKYFKYQHDNETDLKEKIITLINKPDRLMDYWKEYTGLTTMEKHVNELEHIYTNKA